MGEKVQGPSKPERSVWEFVVRRNCWADRSKGWEGEGLTSVAAAESMRARERDDFLVVETHAVEDAAEVIVAFCAVGETTVGSAVAHVAV